MVTAWYCVFSANSGILADPDLQKLRLYESPYVFYAGRWEGGKRGGEGRFCIYQCCRSVKLLKSYKKIEKPNIYFLMDYLNTFFHSIICLLIYEADVPGRDPFNQNFRAEVRNFLGGKWIATGPEGLVPFHSQKGFRAHSKWRMLDSCCSR